MSWPKWVLIPKKGKRAPVGVSRRLKLALRSEGKEQCVYCALPDRLFGGYLHYHVEHFKPKSRFPKLARVWRNLFYACPVCNVLKANDWPTVASGNRYDDPSIVDYNKIFRVDARGGTVAGLTTTARYKVERLNLNRAQLVLARRESKLRARVRVARARCLLLLSRRKGAALAAELNKILDIMEAIGESNPYEPGDVYRDRHLD